MGNHPGSGAGCLKAPVSAIILTYNEADNIEACLDSLTWCGEILVVDSFSQDRTVEISQERGAKVVQHSFVNFSAQRRWALDNLPFSFSWLFFIDADERVTDELAQAIIQATQRNDGRFDAFWVNRKTYLCGKWMQYGGWYPDYLQRVFRKDKLRIQDRMVHAEYSVEGQVGRLSGHLLHFSYRNLNEWMEKTNRYTSLEAQMIKDMKRRPIRWQEFPKGVFWRSVRSWMKDSFPILRPFVMFFQVYILKRGFLDGFHGLVLAILATTYEVISLLKAWDLKQRR